MTRAKQVSQLWNLVIPGVRVRECSKADMVMICFIVLTCYDITSSVVTEKPTTFQSTLSDEDKSVKNNDLWDIYIKVR